MISSDQTKNWLVVFNHLEKYESQWEGLSLYNILWKTKAMFQTTNQMLFNNG